MKPNQTERWALVRLTATESVHWDGLVGPIDTALAEVDAQFTYPHSGHTHRITHDAPVLLDHDPRNPPHDATVDAGYWTGGTTNDW